MDVSPRAKTWAFLESASIIDEPAPATFDLDMDFLVAKATRHRLMPAAAHFLLKSSPPKDDPDEWERLLIDALFVNRFRCAVATREAARIVAHLEERGVRLACTKGLVLQSSAYHNLGTRAFADMDFMIEPASREMVAEAMTDLGYLGGQRYDFLAQRPIPMPRHERKIYSIFPDHLPHFFRPISGYVAPVVWADFAFSITWFGSAWQVPMEEAMADLRRVVTTVDGESFALPALSLPVDFLFVVTHLFRESWFERTFTKIRLNQFADVWRLWQAMDAASRDRLTDIIDRHDLAAPVAWVCHYVDQLFGGDLVTVLGLGDHCDADWLASIARADGTYYRWPADMRDRLIRNGAVHLESMPAPRHAAGARVN